MSKIGIFGGTFNPIHLGHIRLGQLVLDEIKLDKILYIPDNTPPHKSDRNLACGEDRLNMIDIFIKDYDNMESADIELNREGKSYTFETLLELKNVYPNDELYLITGADMFLTLDKWKEPETIFKTANIIGVPRVNSDFEKMEEYAENVIKPMGAKVFMLSQTVFDTASSTYVRENIEDYQKIMIH
jgi:nicotinate-nucleotide adenylyltransferase